MQYFTLFCRSQQNNDSRQWTLYKSRRCRSLPAFHFHWKVTYLFPTFTFFFSKWMRVLLCVRKSLHTWVELNWTSVLLVVYYEKSFFFFYVKCLSAVVNYYCYYYFNHFYPHYLLRMKESEIGFCKKVAIPDWINFSSFYTFKTYSFYLICNKKIVVAVSIQNWKFYLNKILFDCVQLFIIPTIYQLFCL